MAKRPLCGGSSSARIGAWPDGVWRESDIIHAAGVLGVGAQRELLTDLLQHARQTLAEMLKVSVTDAKCQHFIDDRREVGK